MGGLACELGLAANGPADQGIPPVEVEVDAALILENRESHHEVLQLLQRRRSPRADPAAGPDEGEGDAGDAAADGRCADGARCGALAKLPPAPRWVRGGWSSGEDCQVLR